MPHWVPQTRLCHLVEDKPHLVSVKSFYPLLSLTLCTATFSVLFLQPVGTLPVIPVRIGPRPWQSFPFLMHARLSRALCKCPLIWGALIRQVRALFRGQVGFIPLGYLLCTLAGDEKITTTAGAAFLESMGSFFLRPTCLPLSSAKALFQGDLVEVISILMCVEIPLALRSTRPLFLFSIAAASTGAARRVQIVPKLHCAKTSHGIEAVITDCIFCCGNMMKLEPCLAGCSSGLSDPLSKGCAGWSQQIFLWCYAWLGISNV